jgi:hypothetical protein
MKRILGTSIIVIALAACSKDKFETTPTVKIDSFGPNEVIKGQHFRLVATVTDKEGDVKDRPLLIVRKQHLSGIVNVDTISQSISQLGTPVLDKFELQVTFNYGELEDGTILQNYDGVEREISIGLIVEDNEGNRSDYVESNRITLKKL